MPAWCDTELRGLLVGKVHLSYVAVSFGVHGQMGSSDGPHCLSGLCLVDISIPFKVHSVSLHSTFGLCRHLSEQAHVWTRRHVLTALFNHSCGVTSGRVTSLLLSFFLTLVAGESVSCSHGRPTVVCHSCFLQAASEEGFWFLKWLRTMKRIIICWTDESDMSITL